MVRIPEAARKVVVVTGGASGIGRGLASILAKQGASVIIADHDERRTCCAVAALKQYSPAVHGEVIDMRDYDRVSTLVDKVVNEHGQIDYMFNNAGVAPYGCFREENANSQRVTVDTNVLSVLNGTWVAYRYMAARGSGHIVNISSLAGLIPLPGMAAYCATKAAVVGFSMALRPEASRFGVRVTVACPAFVYTRIRETTAAALGRSVKPDRDPWFVKRLTAQKCAEIILKGVERDQALVVVPRWANAAWLAYRFLPTSCYQAAIRYLARFTLGQGSASQISRPSMSGVPDTSR